VHTITLPFQSFKMELSWPSDGGIYALQGPFQVNMVLDFQFQKWLTTGSGWTSLPVIYITTESNSWFYVYPWLPKSHFLEVQEIVFLSIWCFNMNMIVKTTTIGGPKKYVLASFNLLKVIALFHFHRFVSRVLFGFSHGSGGNVRVKLIWLV
jgi:hypothetical protein